MTITNEMNKYMAMILTKKEMEEEYKKLSNFYHDVAQWYFQPENLKGLSNELDLFREKLSTYKKEMHNYATQFTFDQMKAMRDKMNEQK